ITINNASFSWTGTDNVTTVGSLVYAFRLAPLEATFSPFTSPTSKTYPGLTNGSYTFIVKAKDQAGNEDPSPASCSFTVAVPDTTPPDTTITTGPSGTLTVNSATLTWPGINDVTPPPNFLYSFRPDPL